MLSPPKVKTQIKAAKIQVTVSFDEGQQAESGRLFWIHDRAPDGSLEYITKDSPSDNFMDMDYDAETNSYSFSLPIVAAQSHIDFYRNHRKTLHFMGQELPTHISSPYTRVYIK